MFFAIELDNKRTAMAKKGNPIAISVLNTVSGAFHVKVIMKS
jgi:hypothetical protein